MQAKISVTDVNKKVSNVAHYVVRLQLTLYNSWPNSRLGRRWTEGKLWRVPMSSGEVRLFAMTCFSPSF